MAERIEFSRSLYREEAVAAAVEAFKDLAKLELSETDTDLVVAVADVDADVEDVLVDELANYALHETVVRARG